MLDDVVQSSQFYISNSLPCPYLPERSERMVFTVAKTKEVGSALYDALVSVGFRRTQRTLFRPHCVGCNACQSARVRIRDFQPSRSQRKIARKNRNLIRRVTPPKANVEQFALFQEYLAARHPNGTMCSFDFKTYSSMVEETPTASCLVLYFKEDDPKPGVRTMVAASLTDFVSDGLSMVYSFFDPRHGRNSVGTYVILDHVELGRELGFEYLYLGYWVPGSRKMEYKSNFRPLELFRDGRWVDFSSIPHE